MFTTKIFKYDCIVFWNQATQGLGKHFIYAITSARNFWYFGILRKLVLVSSKKKTCFLDSFVTWFRHPRSFYLPHSYNSSIYCPLILSRILLFQVLAFMVSMQLKKHQEFSRTKIPGKKCWLIFKQTLKIQCS